MNSFDWKKNVEDFIKGGLIITAITTRMFYVLKAANVKPPKASVDAMDIMKLVGGIVGSVLVKDYAFYKKWIKEWYNKKIYGSLKVNNIILQHLVPTQPSITMGHCILRAKNVACNITTASRCFFDLKQYTTFFYCSVTAMECVTSAQTCINP